MGKKIGLSLSFCVKQICDGLIAIEEVEKIVAGTRAKNEDDWKVVFSSYRRVYWRDFPDEAERIARELINDGKVEQPGLVKFTHVPVIEPGEFWVNNESEIRWYDVVNKC